MLNDFTGKVEVLTKLNKSATTRLDGEHLKDVAIAGSEMKGALKAAMNGDTKGLNNFIQKHANSNK